MDKKLINYFEVWKPDLLRIDLRFDGLKMMEQKGGLISEGTYFQFGPILQKMSLTLQPKVKS